jgi:hypothetical protein
MRSYVDKASARDTRLAGLLAEVNGLKGKPATEALPKLEAIMIKLSVEATSIDNMGEAADKDAVESYKQVAKVVS